MTYIRTAEHRKKMSILKKDYKPSQETKDKISQSKRGSIPWNKGKKLPPFSKERRENMGKARKGKKHSLETRKRISEGQLGKLRKNGRTINSNGYILIRVYNHPFASKRRLVMEHRLVMEKHIGRYLTREEVVHHKGIKYPIGSIENVQDNRIENLQLFANDIKHKIFHKKLRLRNIKFNQHSK